QVRQLGRDLFPVAAEPILLFGGQGARDTSALGGSHGDLSAGLRDFIGRDRRNRHGVDRFVHRGEVANVLGVPPNARKAGGPAIALAAGVADHVFKVVLGHAVCGPVLNGLVGPQKVEGRHRVSFWSILTAAERGGSSFCPACRARSLAGTVLLFYSLCSTGLVSTTMVPLCQPSNRVGACPARRLLRPSPEYSSGPHTGGF